MTTTFMHLYNTATRRIEPFEALEDGHVRMYSCGPTVYSTAHIGNMRTFLLADMLKRALMASGFSVTHVMNITDVGHLTHDDEVHGQDKMELAASRQNTTAAEIALMYTKEFMDDLHLLNCIPADHYPRATDFISAQIGVISELEKKGFTYKTSDGIYFDTSKFPAYGKLSRQKLSEKEEGARVEKNPEKKNANDFALWKFSPSDTKRQMEWPSPWGVGFPGWHIECSAMSRELLGQPFDIHTGGIDLISPHHENEIAQSVAAFGAPLARFWVHGEFIIIDGGKMAKSIGNVYTLAELVDRGFSPLAFRYLVLGAQYRSKLNFSFEALAGAGSALKNIRDEVRTWDLPSTESALHKEKFLAAIADDLDTPTALAVMWDLIKSNLASGVKAATLLEMDEVLGLQLAQWISKPLVIPSEVRALADERLAARAQKNFALADDLRKKILDHGFLIEDTPDNYTLREV